MAEGIVRLPDPAAVVTALLDKGYCVCCVKERIGLANDPLDEVMVVAQQRPGALDGHCVNVKCGHERRLCLSNPEKAN